MPGVHKSLQQMPQTALTARFMGYVSRKKMRDLRTRKISKITDSVEFEYLCRDIWKNEHINEPVSFHGRPGQAQDGVDVYGRNTETREWFGIQCKVREESNPLNKKEIYNEINKAKNFNPSLKKYYFCTTLKRDATLQAIEREIIEDLEDGGCFSFRILFWNDIEELLKEEKNINIYHKYYQRYFISNTTLGHSIGKLINLELGIGGSLDTHYELVIGKIPDYKDKKHGNVDYYRGVYYIVNFHERKMETFRPRCFETDLEAAFYNKFDCFRIVNWLNSIKNLDDFIYDDTYDIEFYLSDEEYEVRLKSIRDENGT
jgi:hypothetical protein